MHVLQKCMEILDAKLTKEAVEKALKKARANGQSYVDIPHSPSFTWLVNADDRIEVKKAPAGLEVLVGTALWGFVQNSTSHPPPIEPHSKYDRDGFNDFEAVWERVVADGGSAHAHRLEPMVNESLAQTDTHYGRYNCGDFRLRLPPPKDTLDFEDFQTVLQRFGDGTGNLNSTLALTQTCTALLEEVNMLAPENPNGFSASKIKVQVECAGDLEKEPLDVGALIKFVQTTFGGQPMSLNFGTLPASSPRRLTAFSDRAGI